MIRMKKKLSCRKYSIEIVVLIIIAIILVNTLFIYPVMGKSDNGDFHRLTLYGGLLNLSNEYENIYDGAVHIHYLILSPTLYVPFYIDWVSEAIVIKIAVFIFMFVHNFHNSMFDIRYLSFVYSIMFLMAVFLIINFKEFSNLLKLTAGIFIILFFTDTSYLEYFNSFFGEAGTIVFFFLSIGTYLNLISKDNPKIRHFVYFFIASACFLTSKSQELPLLLFMLIIYGGLFVYYKNRGQRKCIIIASILVIIFCGVSYFSLTDTMNENNVYQSVFSGILRGSQTPEKDLQELGINKKFMKFYGHSFYETNKGNDPIGPEMLKEFYPKVSPVKVLGFYFNHLDRLWEKIVDSADNAYDFSLPSKSNFIKGQYTPNKFVNTFRTRLIKKYPYVHRNIYVFIIFSIIYLGVVIFYFIKYKDKNTRLLALMLLFILASGSSQLILPAIGSGHGDFGKHLFLLNLSYDIMIGTMLLWIVHCSSKLITLITKTVKS